MGIFDFIRSQFIDIVEWEDETPGILVHRFQRYDNEIKNGAKLIVRPGQAAIFVNEGQIADHFGPGTYELTTANLPILTNLMSFATAFESWHKAEVYFIRTTVQLDRRWGTQQPLMLRDPDFGVLRIRAFGNYSYRVGTSDNLLERLVGSQSDYYAEALEPQFTMKAVSEFSDCLGELKIPALDLASQYNEISQAMQGKLSESFNALGFELMNFTVVNINLPEEVNQAIDQRGALGALGGVMNVYTQKQAADAMLAAAQNEGMAGNMVGMMMGGQLGNMVGQQAMSPQAGAIGMPPPPPPVSYYMAVNGQQQGPFDLCMLRNMASNGSLTRQTLVWCAGMAGWQAAETVTALQGLFVPLPPPVPPQA